MSNYPFEAHENVSNNRSGIYAIVNLANNKLYIGSAVKLSTRKSQHLYKLNLDKHTNRYLQSSFNKYGSDYFVFKVVEYCETKDLIEREQFWINQFDFDNQLYNLNPIAGSFLGFKHSEESRKKRSEANKGKVISEEQRSKISKANKGRIFSKEHRKKMSEAAKNRSEEYLSKISKANKGKIFSEEHRKKLSEAKKGKTLSEQHRNSISQTKSKKINQIDKLTGEILATFPSVTEAAKNVNGLKGSISSACTGRQKSAYGYRWCYAN